MDSAPPRKASLNKTGKLIEPLLADERADLVNATVIIRRLWGGAPAPRVPYNLRSPQPGDMGWIVHRQAVLYQREYSRDEIVGSVFVVRENDGVARRIFDAAGFELAVEGPHHSFGQDLVGQRWNLTL